MDEKKLREQDDDEMEDFPDLDELEPEDEEEGPSPKEMENAIEDAVNRLLGVLPPEKQKQILVAPSEEEIEIEEE